MRDLYKLLAEQKESEGLRLVTVIEGTMAGEKLLLRENEVLYATDGASALADHVDAFLACEKTGILEIQGMRVFVELFSQIPRLVICGAGTVGLALTNIASNLQMPITVIDDRADYVERACACGASEGICKPFAEGLADIQYTAPTYYVVVTREHRSDKVCVSEILKKPYAYVGLMGSRKRVGILKDGLVEDGFEKEIVEQLHAPIGLSIHADTPEEIAVSILAEIIQIKNEVKKSEGYSSDLLKELIDEEKQMVAATIVDKCGSTPRIAGTKMLIFQDGTITGTIGGGLIEAAAMEKAADMFLTGQHTQMFQFEMTKGESMLCGGSQLVFLERIG